MSKIHKTLIKSNIPGIEVPEKIRNLYLWNNILNDAKQRIKEYKSGGADKTSAASFGRKIYQLCYFIKETSAKGN